MLPLCSNTHNILRSRAISGGDFHYGLHATGPGDCNDNKFYGLGIGMYDSEVAHVYVTGSTTNVKMENIRFEAKDKDMSRPIVIIDDSSYGNVINGILGHTHIKADMNRNPGIDTMSQKSVGLDPAPLNQFWNAAFKVSRHDRRIWFNCWLLDIHTVTYVCLFD